jgi:hypothetical protein
VSKISVFQVETVVLRGNVKVLVGHKKTKKKFAEEEKRI